MKTLRIREVARQAGVTLDTVRFYERQKCSKSPTAGACRSPETQGKTGGPCLFRA